MPQIGIGFLKSAPTAEDLVREAADELLHDHEGGPVTTARLDHALSAYRAYRREHESYVRDCQQGDRDPYWLDEAREAMFAAFDALERG